MVDPCKLVENAVVVVLPQATQKGLSIDTQLPDGGTMSGLYDEEKLAAIMSNLLTNAVKFTDKGKIRVMLECGTSGMEVVIADTGMGIRAWDLGRAFDEFQQLEDLRKHKPSGFGVGLAIVAAMVDVIGGSLIVSSRRGVGTAFTLYAPSLAERRPRKRKSA